MQLYVGMDIGTAKLPIDRARRASRTTCSTSGRSTKSAAVAEYQQLARAAIAEIAGARQAADPRRRLGPVPARRARPARVPRRVAGDPRSAARRARCGRPARPASHGWPPSTRPRPRRSCRPTARRIVRALEVIELTGAPFTATMPGFESIYDARVHRPRPGRPRRARRASGCTA